MIATILYISLLAAFLLLLARKLGGIEWLQVHGNDLVWELASCEFCLSWWVCLVLSCCAALFTGDWHCLLAAPFATPLTRMLI